MAERELKEIRIVEVKEMKAHDGRKFPVYKAMAKNGKLMDVRFTQACTGEKPVEPCIIVVPKDQCSVDKRSYYPALWIKEVVECKPFERKSNVDDYFD